MAVTDAREREPHPPMPDVAHPDWLPIQADLHQKYAGEPDAEAVQLAALLSISARHHSALYHHGEEPSELLFGEHPVIVFDSLVGQLVNFVPLNPRDSEDSAIGIVRKQWRLYMGIRSEREFEQALDEAKATHHDLAVSFAVDAPVSAIRREHFIRLSIAGKRACDKLVCDATRTFREKGELIPDTMLDQRLTPLFFDPDYFRHASPLLDDRSESTRERYAQQAQTQQGLIVVRHLSGLAVRS